MAVTRTMAAPLIPEEVQREIIESMPEYSTVMKLGKRAANMSRKQRRIPCLSALPTAYFSNPGPNNLCETEQWKRQTTLEWENKYLDAEELNCIVVIPEAVFEDADYNIWEEAKPKLLEAFGIAIDAAIFYGISAPAVWPTAIVPSAIAAGNFVVLGSTVNPDTGLNDIYEDILGLGGTISQIENDGLLPNGHISDPSMRGRLRSLRGTDGVPIFKSLYKEGVQGNTAYSLDGSSLFFPMNGVMDPSRSLMISGDWSKLMYAMRKDVTWKILDQAIIQHPVTGAILYNLAQQDMIALRACMRLAWQVPNPINRINEDEDTRYPFSVLLPAQS